MQDLTRAQIEPKLKLVIDVRYSDLELEKSLCLELLDWGQLHQDSYVIAFANAYLGDYYIAQSNSEQCIIHLMKARNIATNENYNDLLLRIYSLLGFYYERIADEQSSLRYYIEGISLAHEAGDLVAEALIYNNIAYNLQRNHGYQQALNFYQQAYDLLLKNNDLSLPIVGIVLNNMATVCTLLNHLDEARKYILECEKICLGTDHYDIFRSQNWCLYYVVKKDLVKARYWADCSLALEKAMADNKNYDFDIYMILFDGMMQIKDRAYAEKFLTLIKKYCAQNSAYQRKQFEIRRMNFYITFIKDEDQLDEAYRRYSIHIRELNNINNHIITNGLRDAMSFYQVTKQKEDLKKEQYQLDHQVNIDELTKVYTRRYLDNMINEYEQSPVDVLGFIMIDVDCLKEYNDTYGHLQGDQALQYVGTILNHYAPSNIYPSRFGGDEFVCLCVNSDDQQIITYIESIRKALAIKNIAHRSSRCANQVTLSIGFANEEQKKVTEIQEILQLADKALYQAKLNGRNTYSKSQL